MYSKEIEIARLQVERRKLLNEHIELAKEKDKQLKSLEIKRVNVKLFTLTKNNIYR